MADKCPAMKVTVKGEPKKVFEQVKKVASKNGVVITGDATKGKMSYEKFLAGKVYGTYTVKGQDVHIQMYDDIKLADCKKINKMVGDFFKGL